MIAPPPPISAPRARIIVGHCIDGLRTLPAESVRTCVTSPPYFNLRSYLDDEDPDKAFEIGSEPTPDEFVASLVEVFREVRRVLANDGTVWLNLGDSYNAYNGNRGPGRGLNKNHHERMPAARAGAGLTVPALKNKDLIGIPWRVALALQADGWWLRQDIIWHKPNPMPAPVKDRCVTAHEYIFLLAKSPRYFIDHNALIEPAAYAGQKRGGTKNRYAQNGGNISGGEQYDTRTKRSVWSADDPASLLEWLRDHHPVVAAEADTASGGSSVWSVCPKGYKGAKRHFATFPAELIEPCVLAGSAPGDLVLDPFLGSGTTACVALKHGRRAVGCELKREYAENIARPRIAEESGVQALVIAAPSREEKQ